MIKLNKKANKRCLKIKMNLYSNENIKNFKYKKTEDEKARMRT